MTEVNVKFKESQKEFEKEPTYGIGSFFRVKGEYITNRLFILTLHCRGNKKYYGFVSPEDGNRWSDFFIKKESGLNNSLTMSEIKDHFSGCSVIPIKSINIDAVEDKPFPTK